MNASVNTTSFITRGWNIAALKEERDTIENGKVNDRSDPNENSKVNFQNIAEKVSQVILDSVYESMGYLIHTNKPIHSEKNALKIKCNVSLLANKVVPIISAMEAKIVRNETLRYLEKAIAAIKLQPENSDLEYNLTSRLDYPEQDQIIDASFWLKEVPSTDDDVDDYDFLEMAELFLVYGILVLKSLEKK